MRKSSRQKKAVSYGGESDDEDAGDNLSVPDFGGTQRGAAEFTPDGEVDVEEDNDDGDDASSEEDDEDRPTLAAAAGKAREGKKNIAVMEKRKKKIKSASIGMKGLCEYALSDQASCKICHNKIEFGELRIGKFRRAAKFDGFIPLWYHSECYLCRWWHTILYVEQLGGYDRLRWEDIVRLDKELETPKRTPEEEQHLDALKHEVNTLWAWHAQLANMGLETRELRTLLETNKQPVFGKKDALRLRCAEIWIHGALPQCPHCSNGVLYFYPNQVQRVLLTLPDALKERLPELGQHPPQLVPLAPRRTIMRKQKKPRAPKEATAEVTKKKEKEGKGGEEPSAFVRGTVHSEIASSLVLPEVVKNSAGEFLSVAMSMSDITTGTNSYYIVQVIQHKASKEMKKPKKADDGSGKDVVFTLFCKWGRTGTYIGSSKESLFWSEKDAVAEFESVFEDKSGNPWKDRFNFQKRAGKLCPIDLDSAAPAAAGAPSTAIFSSETKALDPRVANLVTELFSTEMLLATLEALDVDVKKMPIGKISKRQVQNGYLILRELSNAIEQGNQGPQLQQSILDLTNRFYTMIPHQFGRRRPPLIDNKEILASKFSLLDALLNIEIAASLDRLGQNSPDPILVRYNSLQTQIAPIDQGDPIWLLMDKYLIASEGEFPQFRMKLLEVYHIARQGESETFSRASHNLMNHKMLWHGSRTANFVGILSQGLRIAPPEAPPSGYMFGKGIYFADVAAKSGSFCGATSQYPFGYLLVSQVALGTSAEVTTPHYMEKPMHSTNSTWAKGQRGPSDYSDNTEIVIEARSTEDCDTTCKVPLGRVDTVDLTSPLRYSEYVVYDTSQICQRWLVKVGFQFAQP